MRLVGSAKESVVRASALVAVFVLAGHAINYLLFILANRVLPAESFGVYYAAISTVNILVAPATVVHFLAAQHLSEVEARSGAAAVPAAYRRLAGDTLPWAAALMAVAGAGLVGLGLARGADTPLVGVLVAAIAFSELVIELGRAAFQGMRRHLWYGGSWVVWMVARLAFCLVPVALGLPVWVGLAGILVSTLGAALVLALALGRGEAAEAGAPVLRVQWGGALVNSLGYALVVLLLFSDILLAYVVLDGDELGRYAASALLPKAVLVATTPILQVAIPVLAGVRARTLSAGVPLAKALVLTALVSAGGSIALGLLNPLLCDSAIGLKNCRGDAMAALLPALLPMALARLLAAGSGGVAVPALAAGAGLVWLGGRAASMAVAADLIGAYVEAAWIALGLMVVGIALRGSRRVSAT